MKSSSLPDAEDPCADAGLYPRELASCIAEDRDPTVEELFSVARRIWTEGATTRHKRDWERLVPADRQRILALRAAAASLSGSPADA